jgi:hypothetical protein
LAKVYTRIELQFPALHESQQFAGHDGRGALLINCVYEGWLEPRRERRPSERHITETVQSAVEEFLSQGTRPTKKQVVTRVRKHPGMESVSTRQIEIIYRTCRPHEWGRPGRPKSRHDP